MIKNLKSNIDNSQIKEDAIDELDLKVILNMVLRNKALIGFFSIITFVFGILYSYTLKEVWEGQFQIVLNVKNNSPNTDTLASLANLSGINTEKENELNTEVEILKSPSVLMPVFEFAKEQNNQTIASKLSFSTWRENNLKIVLENNTSILNISYKNTNKKTIIPILNKMSTSYQLYSGKNKRRSQELKNKFLKEQISFFQKKSANSLKAAQEYAIDQDLVFYDFGIANRRTISSNFSTYNSPSEATNLVSPNIGIENVRVQAANKIRKINLQLQKIKELNDPDELQYIGSTIPALVKEGLPKALSDIKEKLSKARSIFTDEDILIKNLIKERNLVIDSLQNRTIKYLEFQKLDAEATMQASMRPKDVLLNYKELIRKAARYEQTLIQLEDKFNLFKLELASQEDPWELITKPTLLENRISPNRKSIASVSLIIGLILGVAFSLIKEKKLGKIYDSSEIERLIPIRLISQIDISKIDSEKQKLLFIKDLLNQESNGLINFVPIGNIEEQELAKLKDSLMQEKFIKDIKFSSNKDEIKEYSNYLILKLGHIKYSDISILKKRLELLENVFNGLFILA